MHANSHDPRSSPAYVGPQFAPAIAVDDETVAIVGASTRAAFRATHGATTTAAAAPATTSATAAAREPRRRPLQATGPITNGTSSSPSARVNAANPASAPAAPHSHALPARAACNASSIVPSASGTKTVSAISEPSAAIRIGLIAASAAATSPIRVPAIRRPISPVNATVTLPVATPASCAARIESPATDCTRARNAG